MPQEPRHHFLLNPLSLMAGKYSSQPPKILSLEERKARELARKADAEQAMREHAAAQEAFHKNRERLKAERLAREGRIGDGAVEG
jgi:hypothetical protein